VVGERARRLDALEQGSEPVGILERIAGGDQPPDPVELEPPEREQRGAQMRLMWWIESAAEQADPHAGGVRRQQPFGKCG
jgi:hypothetical protein